MLPRGLAMGSNGLLLRSVEAECLVLSKTPEKPAARVTADSQWRRPMPVPVVLPFPSMTGDNPASNDQAAFAKTALALNEGRPKFLAGFFRTFFGVDPAPDQISGESLAWALSVSIQPDPKTTLKTPF